MGIELAIILFLVGLALIPIELFVPSGGILTGLSVASVLASVVIAFVAGQTEGLIFLGCGVVLMPASWLLMIKVFPHTSMGKRVIQDGSALDEKGRKRGVILENKALLGSTGTAITDLRPAGLIEVAGERVDVVTDGEYIDEGSTVEVIQADANRVIVRLIGAPA